MKELRPNMSIISILVGFLMQIWEWWLALRQADNNLVSGRHADCFGLIHYSAAKAM